jgi:DNA modification methylase
MNRELLLGDCLEQLKNLPDNSIDSIVTDPPYGLSFMGKKWDYDVPSTEIWKECFRVLKPGGHLLSFGGSRTYHRLAVNVEDAGFEIRDQIQWIYGSGFPKSHNIGKAVDKKLGNDREVVGETKAGKTALGQNSGWNSHENRTEIEITKGNSEWEGWGTALKPAHEPIVMARKPLSEKTVVDNVLKHGTGGINIDESRIGNIIQDTSKNRREASVHKTTVFKSGLKNDGGGEITEGRFPANIILSEESAENLDEHTGILKGDSPNRKPRNGGHRKKYVGTNNNEKLNDVISDKKFTDEGGASRYFYVAKPSKKEKTMGLEKNNHPTVKPIKLMEYLVKMVTPIGGTTLDPFLGSGTTGIAALKNGFNFIGIEREEEYMDIAQQRIDAWTKDE